MNEIHKLLEKAENHAKKRAAVVDLLVKEYGDSAFGIVEDIIQNTVSICHIREELARRLSRMSQDT